MIITSEKENWKLIGVFFSSNVEYILALQVDIIVATSYVHTFQR